MNKVFIHFITGFTTECETMRSRSESIEFIKSHYDLAWVRYVTFGSIDSSDKVDF